MSVIIILTGFVTFIILTVIFADEGFGYILIFRGEETELINLGPLGAVLNVSVSA